MVKEEIIKRRYPFYDRGVKDVELNGEAIIQLMEDYHNEFMRNPSKVGEWCGILGMFSELYNKGFNLRPIKDLVTYIISKGYFQKLNGGTSVYTLRISISNDTSKTLLVRYEKDLVVFDYYENRALQRKKPDWAITCQPSEVIDTFEFFISENIEWGNELYTLAKD